MNFRKGMYSQESICHLLILVHQARPTQNLLKETWQYPYRHTLTNLVDKAMRCFVLHSMTLLPTWLLTIPGQQSFREHSILFQWTFEKLAQMCFRIQFALPGHLCTTLITTIVTRLTLHLDQIYRLDWSKLGLDPSILVNACKFSYACKKVQGQS
jgi:hypothetical protein